MDHAPASTVSPPRFVCAPFGVGCGVVPPLAGQLFARCARSGPGSLGARPAPPLLLRLWKNVPCLWSGSPPPPYPPLPGALPPYPPLRSLLGNSPVQSLGQIFLFFSGARPQTRYQLRQVNPVRFRRSAYKKTGAQCANQNQEPELCSLRSLFFLWPSARGQKTAWPVSPGRTRVKLRRYAPLPAWGPLRPA